MRRFFLILTLALAGTAEAQELTLFAGGVEDTASRQRSSAWAFEYQHPLGENFAASFAWLNEGHVPGHHRDGQAIQIWGRGNLFDRRLSLAAGVGPYRYSDTTPAPAGRYANLHGWGTIGSLAATYYADSRWMYQIRYNRILTPDSIDTRALMFGIGYLLEPMSSRGPQDSVPRQAFRTTNDELTLFLGKAIVNSYESELSAARSVEYRRGLARHIDVTLGVLSEGNARLIRRTGLTAQIWGVREVLASDRLVLGIGFGPYLAVDRYRAPEPGEGEDSRFSWIFTATAAYRFSEEWTARASWNRVSTNHHRDTDVLLLGAGYRF